MLTYGNSNQIQHCQWTSGLIQRLYTNTKAREEIPFPTLALLI